ncbi:ATP-dependent DNA helicase, RecQ-like [Raineyella antarctica]|uniref:DNA 3'-5' helicase n=1 Tax=Raineyella antarctica TaxID=1577474 RepID=A0A1G6HNG2_9ACTN|nr:RecQ family ATP-dependent DNA helicase [Raineyella antarctica]SDB95425.1 ATP-dependent DNA helicase, RecQ-like [Raineyella antarctica]
MTLRDDARTILRDLTGVAEADFRDGQYEAIEALVADRRRALVVQRTGWGKSAVYFVSCLLRRRQGAGATVIVSPLLALMRDQLAAAERAGIRAAAINSANATEWGETIEAVRTGAVDLLLISPERLTNPRFREDVLPTLVANMGLLVVDEAHCISDWGHDFRPDYRRIRDLIAQLPDGVPILATTATANSRVITDVAEQLGVRLVGDGPADPEEVFVVRGPLARDSLRLGVLRLPTARHRLGWLLAHLDDLPGSGIIYALTISAAEDTARLLADHGHRVRSYTGRTDPADREAAEKALKDNEVKALVATSALGMGFDKPDLGFVVHLGAPSSPVAYYQQVGRAGRAVETADVLLLPGPEDRDIWQYFASASMPSEARASAVLAALAEADRPLSAAALEARVDIRRTPLELLLKVLAVDGSAEKVQQGWRTTGVPWTYDAERYGRIAAARTAEQGAMVEYEAGAVCRMEFLTAQLDDPQAHPCGRCDVCLRAAGEPAWYPQDVPGEVLAEAGAQLAHAGVPIEPRRQWPSGMDRLGIPLKGRIPAGETLEEGRAIARLTDLGHGRSLREMFAPDTEGRPVDRPLPTELATACIQVLSGWNWQARPVAVIGVGSVGRPELVASTVAGLARVGRLLDLGVLPLHAGAGPTTTGNSAFRLASVWDRWEVPAELAERLADLAGPVLLVDDLVDSRWTMAVAGRLLRRAGAPGVLPLALGVAG